ncbi:hypothetical protein [Roseateles depolymerans]|uniref:hypothetical protein n=1 Tax=Roseateles depolymerans TaxID=76731 RepID=UPI0011C031E3|nr:hypothetical protein [Roseateles depolymerans]
MAERIKREYAAALLSALPDVASAAGCPEPVVEGYKSIATVMLRSARRCQAVADPRLITSRTHLAREAGAARSLFDAVRLHLIARQLNALSLQDNWLPDLELVLIAEQQVEAFLEDIELPLPSNEGGRPP